MQKYKVVLVGDSGVGKTALLHRFKTGRHSAHHDSTIGCEFFAKEVLPHGAGGPAARLLIWDTAGQQAFRDFTPNFLRGAKCVCVCASTADRGAFDSVPGWAADVRSACGADVPLVLVGTKCDLPGRAVSAGEFRACAVRLGAQWHETSALSGAHVDSLFRTVARLAAAQGAPPQGGGVALPPAHQPPVCRGDRRCQC
jgi:small GTP-binding protein